MHHAHRDRTKGKSQENPITRQGRKEAAAIGEILRIGKVPVTCIYSGEYLRYRQTNELINKYTKAPITTDSRLNEIDCDVLEYEKRIHNFLRDVIAKHSNKDIIICMTSGVALSCFMSYFINGKPIKGFKYAQGATVSPVIFEYDKE